MTRPRTTRPVALHRGLIAALLTLTLALLAAPNALAARSSSGSIDLGVSVGNPTGIELGLSQDSRVGLDFGFGTDHLYGSAAAYFDAEFRLFTYQLGQQRRVNGRFYIGPGLLAAFGVYDAHRPGHKHDHDHADFDLIVTAPIGTSLKFKRPVRIFVELRPGLSLLDHPGHFHVGGQFGVAYVF